MLAYDLKILDLIKGKRYDTVEEYYKAIDRYESDRVEHVKKSDLPKKKAGEFIESMMLKRNY